MDGHSIQMVEKETTGGEMYSKSYKLYSCTVLNHTSHQVFTPWMIKLDSVY